jgi:RecB family exonuclease
VTPSNWSFERGMVALGLEPESWFRRASGLKPSVRLVAGTGVTREDVKGALLGRGLGFTGRAVVGFEELAHEVISAFPAASDPSAGFRVAQSSFRQEVLRHLLDRSEVSRFLPELDRLRRQTPFFRRLDRALQNGRLSYVSESELEVMEAALQGAAAGPSNPLRPELKLIALAYEAWLGANGWMDPVMLYREAIRRLTEASLEGLSLPGSNRDFLVFTAGRLDPLISEFLDQFARLAEVTRVTAEARDRAPAVKWQWSRAHTLDDAAEFLVDGLLARAQSGDRPCPWSDLAILIPDQPEVRRTLMRALSRRKVPLEDPRDPTRVRMEESVKRALSILEMVASRFERERVLAWMRARARDESAVPEVAREIARRGVREGLEAYGGGRLADFHAELVRISKRYVGRFACADVAALHLEDLKQQVLDSGRKEDSWVLGFFESQWKSLEEDLSWLDRDRDEGSRRMPVLAWLERLRLRLVDAAPPAPALATPDGVRIYRLSQAASVMARELILFGLPGDWLQGEGGSGAGDYFFTRRERDRLAIDFSLRSVESVRKDRREALESWLQEAESCQVLDAEFDWDGAERGGIWPVLRELGFPSPPEMEPGPSDLGAHPRWLAGFSSDRMKPSSSVKIGALPSAAGPVPVSASQLEAQSRCPFVGMAQGRWRLDDIKMPAPSLWPEERGKLLHEAVRLLMQTRDEAGRFTLSCSEALEKAWQAALPRGLLPSRRFRENARRGMLRVLEAFSEVEREWQQRVGTTPVALDQEEIRYGTDDYIISGRPDRVDEWHGHLIVMDYKTGASNPTGREILEYGTRLQMPFYGLAAHARWNKPVAGTQFVVLGRENDRSRGLFFETFVDTSSARKKKDPADPEAPKPFRFSSRNASIVKLPLEEGWEILKRQVDRTAREYLEGRHDPLPREPDECKGCRFADLCGFSRVGAAPGSREEP